jgi:hypothetical protein
MQSMKGSCRLSLGSALRVAGVVAAAVLAFLVAGCGGGSAKGVAHLGSATSTTTTAPASGASGSGSAQSANSTQLQKYSECMRSHGLPSFPDPVNGQLRLTVTKGGPLDPTTPQFRSAAQACKALAPSGIAGGSGSSTAAQAQILTFARCMRSHGVTDFPDPKPNGGFLMSGNIQNNPNFQPAIRVCLPLLPGGTGATP